MLPFQQAFGGASPAAQEVCPGTGKGSACQLQAQQSLAPALPTEVCQLELARVADEQVLRLQVAVQDVALVDVGEASQQLEQQQLQERADSSRPLACAAHSTASSRLSRTPSRPHSRFPPLPLCWEGSRHSLRALLGASPGQPCTAQRQPEGSAAGSPPARPSGHCRHPFSPGDSCLPARHREQKHREGTLQQEQRGSERQKGDAREPRAEGRRGGGEGFSLQSRILFLQNRISALKIGQSFATSLASVVRSPTKKVLGRD